MSYERAKKKLMISEAPNILTIALKRYQVILTILGYFLHSKVPCAIKNIFFVNLGWYVLCRFATNLYSIIVFIFNANPSSLNSLVFMARSARMSSFQSTWICPNLCVKQMIIVLCTACMLWLSIMMLWILQSLVITYVMWRILRGSGTRWMIAR